MSQPEPPSFHLRLPRSLKEQLQSARGRNSLNREIVERLERSFEPDAATELAATFRPFITTLSQAERRTLFEAVATTLDVLTKKRK